MRLRAGLRFTDVCTIRREETVGTTATNEPTTETVTVVADAACHYIPAASDQSREETGRLVTASPTVRLRPDVAVQEGDTVEIDAVPSRFEVTGVERVRSQRRAQAVWVDASLERVE